MTSPILICGDPHGQFDHIVEATIDLMPRAVILLGDNTPDRALHEELELALGITNIWWIPGNHDTDSAEYYDRQFHSKLAERNLHGRVVNIEGMRVAGLGGVFRTKIWNDNSKANASAQSYAKSLPQAERWRDGVPLRHRSTIFRADIDALSRRQADVLITHEAPNLHEFGSVVITALARTMRVRRAFHGHHHIDRVYPDGVWTGVGLRGIVTLEGDVVRAGEESD